MDNQSVNCKVNKIQSNSNLRNLTNELTERVKELNCLYGISRIVEADNISLEEILNEAVKIIPPAWQYPEITCARIRLKRHYFVTANFRETTWKQAETIFVNGSPYGNVEVFYLKERPQCDEGPFLREERELLHAIAERLGHIIERELANSELKSLYREEKKLRQKLQLEMENKVDFTRRLIHELKTPLTSLMATSQLLYEETQGKKLGKLAGYVWGNACSMNSRISELHDMIKGEIGRLELELKPLDLGKLLLSIVDETAAAASQCDMHLDIKLATPLVKVYADATRVRQVVLNLLNNAFKYASGGGKVTIKAITNADNVTVEIQDYGPGITTKEQKYIFRPYYYPSNKRNHLHGLGIGLALCKVLIEAQGGKIWVKSELGQGSSFYFTLPRLSQVKGKKAVKV